MTGRGRGFGNHCTVSVIMSRTARRSERITEGVIRRFNTLKNGVREKAIARKRACLMG